MTFKQADQVINERASSFYFISDLKKIIRFTPREVDCLKELIQKKTTAQCASTLNISPRTVEFYVNNIKKKVLCRTRKELLRIVVNNNFFKENSEY